MSTPTASAKPNCLMVGSSLKMKLANTVTMMTAAATTTWLLEAVDDGASRRQPLRVGFTHGADEEDLVVHGEPVEDAGDHDRQRLSRGPPVSRPTSPMNRPPPI
jgi:hypothetical protein